MESARPPKVHIAVEGNIAAGKSTFLKSFTKFLRSKTKINYSYLPEPIEMWTSYGTKGINLLDLMYKNQDNQSFNFQMAALQTRLAQFEIYRNTGIRYFLAERSIEVQREVFIPALRYQESITIVQRDIATNMINNLNSLPYYRPHIILYLKTSPEKNFSRISERKRPEERNVPLSYLRMLHELHQKWLVESKDDRVIVINNDDFEKSESFEEIYEQLIVKFPKYFPKTTEDDLTESE